MIVVKITHKSKLKVAGTDMGGFAEGDLRKLKQGQWVTFGSCLELVLGASLVRRLLSHHIEIILLEEAEVLPGLRELTLLHTLTDVPVNEGTLRVHEVVF